MFKRAMVWNTKRNNFILWKIKFKHLTGFLWRSLQSRLSAEKRASYFLSKQRCFLLAGGCPGHPNTATSQRSHDMRILYFCSRDAEIPHCQVLIQVRMQATWQVTTKMVFGITENFTGWENARISWWQKPREQRNTIITYHEISTS